MTTLAAVPHQRGTFYTHMPYEHRGGYTSSCNSKAPGWGQVVGYFNRFNSNKAGAEKPDVPVTQGQDKMDVEEVRRMLRRNKSPAVFAGGLSYTPLLGNTQRDNKHCLVLDLDETLVHSSFKEVETPDKILEVTIDEKAYKVYVKTRPFLQEFIRFSTAVFETVVFTASLEKYAASVLDFIDPCKALGGSTHRLYRQHCTFSNGAYIKDLSLLGRPLHKVCIIDNSPVAYLFQPGNALACSSWFGDTGDRVLLDFIPILKEIAACRSVYGVLDRQNRD
eukprot:TRINITY_DN27096_c0_g1_i1.p1 TRINITY_DN27096_c0_g1~~TRINITY_DN27096_c0_g1_i1.p1  ORF type:complete len:296 (+),score=42.37 TRINITY_DN27096_c0_g1_i1:56-889(+)